MSCEPSLDTTGGSLMPERQQPERDPGPASHSGSTDIPSIETPVIDIQDLEHKPGPDTRVNNTGVKVTSQTDAQRRSDDAEIAKEDAKALEAVDEFERHVKTLPPD
jgi:hypothetical protein